MPYREDEQIGMLIGTNCTKAIKPCKVIPGGHSDPYRLILVGEFLEEVASPPEEDFEELSESWVNKIVINEDAMFAVKS